jgi:hypothetical protein
MRLRGRCDRPGSKGGASQGLAILHANCWRVRRGAKLPAGLLGKLNGSRRLGSFCQKSILVADPLCSHRFAQQRTLAAMLLFIWPALVPADSLVILQAE